jgi:DnaJ-class molecular chaperone
MKDKEYKCKMCDGHGEVDNGWFAPIIEKCPSCKGTGKVDWVTNVTWKKHIRKDIM